MTRYRKIQVKYMWFILGAYMSKICILVRVLWPGGPQRIAFEYAKTLRSAGNIVDLIFIRETERFPKDFTSTEFALLYSTDIKDRKSERILNKLTSHFNPGRGRDATVDLDLILKFELSKDKYDFIIYFDQFTSLFSLIGKIRANSEKIVYIHETAFREKSHIKKIIEKISLYRAKYIITNSNYNKRILSLNGYNNVYVVYPGMEIKDHVNDFPSRRNECIFVTVFEPWRKPEIIIEIAKYLKNGKIVLAGQWADIKYREHIESLIENLNLKDRIHITGKLSQKQLEDLYSFSKVALRFGFDEHGPGMGSLESLSFGLPLIVNEEIGVRELLDKYNYGLIFNDREYIKIANVIDELFANEKKWTLFSNQSLKIAKENSWEMNNKELLRILNFGKGEL